MSTSTHPKRSPSGVSEGVGLKEERLSVRKPSTSTIGSRNIPTPSSPMVSSAHNPNKAEIPDRRKDMNSTTVRNKSCFVVVLKLQFVSQCSLSLISRYWWQHLYSVSLVFLDVKARMSWMSKTIKHEHLPQIKHDLIRQSLRGCSLVVKNFTGLLQSARLLKRPSCQIKAQRGAVITH